MLTQSSTEMLWNLWFGGHRFSCLGASTGACVSTTVKVASHSAPCVSLLATTTWVPTENGPGVTSKLPTSQPVSPSRT